MDRLNKLLNAKLERRNHEGLLRHLGPVGDLIDFTSNDYLGLARSAELHSRIIEKVQSLQGNVNGSTGSRLLSGNTAYAEQVEARLATLFKGEASLLFSSGYTANLAVLSSVPQRGDTIIYDELAHACIKDGARLSLANRFSFKHNDLNDLEEKLKRTSGHVFIAVESIYSMDGDECPLIELSKLAGRYEASIILDEAHSTGVYGEDGSGLARKYGIENKIGIRIFTFGKAMGIHGACVVGSDALRNFLINYARPFIYTTAPPPHSIASVEAAFDYIRDNSHLPQQLEQNVALFRKSLQTATISNSSIQPFFVEGNSNARRVAADVRAHGFDVRPILSPTVREGTERIRICLHTFNNVAEIQSLAALLNTYQ